MNSAELQPTHPSTERKRRICWPRAAQLQAPFWDALLELEGALGGIEIDGNRDLSETSIDELLAEEDSDSGN